MEINEREFDQKIANGDKFVADFSASWCGPCRMFAPIFEKANAEYQRQRTQNEVAESGERMRQHTQNEIAMGGGHQRQRTQNEVAESGERMRKHPQNEVVSGGGHQRQHPQNEVAADKTAKKQNSAVDFVKIDVDACPKIAERYGVRSVPTIILFDRGVAVDAHIGTFKTANEVLAFVNNPNT
jgi:thioredoxin-like negative regulator of GroEL